MKLYEQWENLLNTPQDERSQMAFWNEYYSTETDVYRQLLSTRTDHLEGTAEVIAQDLGLDPVILAGFIDGINTSLKTPVDLETLEESTALSMDIDWHALLFNMHKAKAKWLYDLKEWDGIYTEKERAAIAKEYLATVTAVSKKIGRNDPCPCGSGKKYKYCCGAEG